MKTPIYSCRFCGSPLEHVFTDLGASPLANSNLKAADLNKMEPFFPLCVYVCQNCLLVQLPEHETSEAIFSDYVYFSSFSESWLKHAERYTELMIEQYGITDAHQVVEIASNDGYLLQYFKNRGIAVLGIEPAANVANVALEKGIHTLTNFFSTELARQLRADNVKADLLIGNNVLAHVPTLNDFVEGMKIFLADSGIITMEFPHLLQLMLHNQFDTIYHEHFSYFSFTTVCEVFNAHALEIFNVDQIPTHGGSIRIYARHKNDSSKPVRSSVARLKQLEREHNLDKIETYAAFNQKVMQTKRNILNALIDLKNKNHTIAGYGAPAKGNTLLNYCGIRSDFINYTVDISPYKQNLFLPGSRIPVLPVEAIYETKPDYVLILPWNLKDEIVKQMAGIKAWGGKFITPIPEVRIICDF